jgi:hypothetical protein
VLKDVGSVGPRLRDTGVGPVVKDVGARPRSQPARSSTSPPASTALAGPPKPFAKAAIKDKEDWWKKAAIPEVEAAEVAPGATGAPTEKEKTTLLKNRTDGPEVILASDHVEEGDQAQGPIATTVQAPKPVVTKELKADAKALGVELVSFDEALATADFISLHIPLTSTTDKIFNYESFGKCKKGVRIINVARGGVIDEPAHVRALDAGIVAQAALDVFTVEPPKERDVLMNHENVIVTPQLGASTVEVQEGVAVETAEAVLHELERFQVYS